MENQILGNGYSFAQHDGIGPDHIICDAQLLDHAEGFLLRAAVVCEGERVDVQQVIPEGSALGVKLRAKIKVIGA